MGMSPSIAISYDVMLNIMSYRLTLSIESRSHLEQRMTLMGISPLITISYYVNIMLPGAARDPDGDVPLDRHPVPLRVLGRLQQLYIYIYIYIYIVISKNYILVQ